MFTARGLTDSDFVSHIELHLDGDEPTTEMETRAEPLANLLTLEHATALALAAMSTAAFDAIAERTLHVSGDADEVVATLLRHTASHNAPMTLRATFAQALADADASVYAAAVRQILADTLDVGLQMGERMWSFATAPLADSEKASIWETVKDELSASTSEALSAAVVLYATSADKAFDAMVAKGIEDIMLH